MAFIGKKPTAAPLTSSDVADGIITNAKLAQDIISADTALGATPADTDEFLVSDAGVLKRMDYSHIKAGGAWNLIKTQSITSSTAYMDFIHGTSDVVFDSTYRRYVCILDDLRPYSDNVLFKVHFYIGGSFATSSYQTAAVHMHGATVGAYTGTAYASALDKCGNAADESVYGEIHFINPSSTATKPSCYSRFCTMHNTDDEPNQHFSAGGHTTAAAYTGFRFVFNSGNIGNLQASLYGITTS